MRMWNWIKKRWKAVGSVTATGLFTMVFFGVPDVVNTSSSWFNAASVLMGVVQGDDKVQPNDIADQQSADQQETQKCRFVPSQWKEGSGQLIAREGTTFYSMAPDVYTSTIRYERSIPSKATTKFVFTPESEIINTIILYHDFFELVVGDGDHYGVSLKANLGHEQMELLGRMILSGGIKIGNDITVTIAHKPIARDNYEVVVSIDYMRKDGTPSIQSFSQEFPIPAPFKGTDVPIRASVGFANIQNNQNQEVTAYFKCFSTKTAIEGVEEKVSKF